VHSLLSMNATSHQTLLPGHAVAGPVPMAIAHVLATVALAVILTRADAALAAIADALEAVVPRALPALPAWAPVAVPVTAPCPHAEVMVVLRRVRTRRGPPSDS